MSRVWHNLAFVRYLKALSAGLLSALAAAALYVAIKEAWASFVFGTGARATSGSSERWIELGRLLPTDIRYPRPPGHRLRRRLLVDAAAASRPPDEDRLAIFSAFIQLQKCDQFSHFERGRALQST